MELMRFALGLVLLVVAGAMAVQLWNGRWLSLIAKPQETKKGTFYPGGTQKAGQRAAWVMVACFAVVATLLAFEMGRVTGSLLFAQVATILNNITLVAFCGCMVWAIFAQRKNQGDRARFKDSTRMLLFFFACCVALTLVSLLFA